MSNVKTLSFTLIHWFQGDNVSRVDRTIDVDAGYLRNFGLDRKDWKQSDGELIVSLAEGDWSPTEIVVAVKPTKHEKEQAIRERGEYLAKLDGRIQASDKRHTQDALAALAKTLRQGWSDADGNILPPDAIGVCAYTRGRTVPRAAALAGREIASYQVPVLLHDKMSKLDRMMANIGENAKDFGRNTVTDVSYVINAVEIRKFEKSKILTQSDLRKQFGLKVGQSQKVWWAMQLAEQFPETDLLNRLMLDAKRDANAVPISKLNWQVIRDHLVEEKDRSSKAKPDTVRVTTTEQANALIERMVVGDAVRAITATTQQWERIAKEYRNPLVKCLAKAALAGGDTFMGLVDSLESAESAKELWSTLEDDYAHLIE